MKSENLVQREIPATKYQIDRAGLIGKKIALYKDGKPVVEDKLIMISAPEHSPGVVGLYFEEMPTATIDRSGTFTIKYMARNKTASQRP